MKIKEVDEMTVQEAIEYSLDKLIQQGKRCMLGSGMGCAYADREGNHCAIGWLLDSKNENLMGFRGSAEDISRVNGVPLLIGEYAKVFNLFQSFHDAQTKNERLMCMNSLMEYGINVSSINFQAWADLGE
jgi:hypothetical protein